jgi:hypothetical protein
MEREQVYKEMQGYKEMDRDMQGLREMPRATNLAVADGIVNDLLSTAHSQFRDFVPREDFVPRDPSSALNYVRGEASKTPGRASPAARTPFRPEGDEIRVPHRLISPAAFEPQFGVQSSAIDFSLHSSTGREELIFDYDLSKVLLILNVS